MRDARRHRGVLPLGSALMLGGAFALLVAVLMMEGGTEAEGEPQSGVAAAVTMFLTWDQLEATTRSDAETYLQLADPNAPVAEALESVGGMPTLTAAPALRQLFEMNALLAEAMESVDVQQMLLPAPGD